ncbi:G-protein coupled receptor 20-like isoform X1 [Oncorhynchus tshawytscha]|uniref:G-protein coupled receptor 20-like isoform X1 n=2 Tax=Oncorhynchus tshawytscha TaxID=74940 RepID=UPI001C3E82F0|nr:G-protein coupled receptor 20-like isoform X1 [Oncorhynchus tshawytscha]XP_042171469.1 G-protein coupled receptor 20-like isoform X1 [Oncorhynchus tshawytscha]
MSLVICPLSFLSGLIYCFTRMNDSSGNHTDLEKWDVCVDQGYVVPKLSGAVQALCSLLGIPALVWCLWLSLSGSLSGGLKPTQVFPINLFAVELVFCVHGLLEVISYLFIPKAIMLRQTVYVLYYISWICRPLIQSCICVERYLAVAQPVSFLKYRLRRYRVACSTMVWLLSLAFACSIISLFGYEETSGYVIGSVYCLGLAVISLCCFFILRVLKQPGPGEVEGGREGEKNQGTTDPHKKRAFGIILTNLVVILASSIPVVVGYATLSYSLDYNCNVIPMLQIVNVFSVLVSPLMHLYREGRLSCRRGPETH